MHNSLESTRQFMTAAGQEVKTAPGIPTREVLELRLSLEAEELKEKAQAMGLERSFAGILISILDDLGCNFGYDFEMAGAKNTGIFNMAEVLDACADQRVVADGTILACGLQDVFDAALDDVSGSNMSKFCATHGEAEDTVDEYSQKGVDVQCKYAGQFGQQGPWVVRRASDGKILKSISYRPANMQAVLDNFYQSL